MSASSFLVKHDLRSQRVKGVCFHSKRPWVLVGLHSGVVHIVDHRTGNIVDRFEEHEGPVRGVDFHSQQPIFATGGDDCKIKLWNYKLRRCTATLLGHTDYVRTVNFHREAPWLVSASDDQVLIVWNWQARSRLAFLAGHNHYVMSAQFHPTQDYVVSASLDLTCRLWDVSGLRFKRQDNNAQDLFGSGSEVSTRAVMEGHDKGVNFASFHPTRPYIVSAADDRTIRIWRMDDTRVFEVDHLRGHTANVSCVMYCHTDPMYIISNSEDRTIRVWDSNSKTQLYVHRRELERFWVLNVHPTQNLIAAGHDNGLIIFKLERERPAMCLTNNNKTLLYVHERHVYKYEFATGKSQAMCKLRRQPTPPLTLSPNPGDSTVVAGYDVDGGTFESFTVPSNPSNQEVEVRRGFFSTPVFFAANKFASIDKTRQIVIRITTNDQIKTIPPHKNTDRLFPGPSGFIVCRSDDNVALYDVAQRAAVAELPVSHVKYVVWDPNFQKVAFLSKHHITIATRRLKVIATIHETSRIKSACFDDTLGVLIYTTHNHIKYCALQSGETGTLRTIENVIYLVRVAGDLIWFVDRQGRVTEQKFDNTELTFKLALQQERFRDVLKLIQTQKVHGQALVAYLHKHGHPEIAMHFAEDPNVKFNLAVECGLLAEAKAAAVQLNTADCWRTLSAAAMKAGDIQMAQLANAKLKNFTALGIQCIITGNHAALEQVMARGGDDNTKLHLSFLAGDGNTRAQILANAGQLPLAYLTARNEGNHELADELLTRMAPEVAARVQAQPSQPLPEIEEGEPCDENWPQLPVQESYFMRMLKAPGEFDIQADDAAAAAGGKWGDDDDDDLFGDAKGGDDEDLFGTDTKTGAGAVAGAAGGGEWDDEDLEIDDALLPAAPADTGASSGKGAFVVPREHESVAKHWVENSDVPAAHVAAGSFITAVRLLQRQIGLIDANPLKSTFFNLWTACNASLPTASTLPPLTLSVATRPPVDDMRSKHFPSIPRNLAALKARLDQGYAETTNGKFTDALVTFTSLMHQLLLAVVDTKEDAAHVRDMLSISREYVAALSLEMARKEAANAGETKRALELAVYFTHFKLQSVHLILALGQAMNQTFKAKNHKTAGALARRLLDLDPPAARAETARKVVQVADKTPTDEIPLDYDERNPFVLCAVKKAPMYRGTVEPIRCPFCGSQAHPSYRGQVCPNCKISALGTEGSGLVTKVIKA